MTGWHNRTGRRPLLQLLAENRAHPLRAARGFPWWTVPRRACLGGFYDLGEVVRGRADG